MRLSRRFEERRIRDEEEELGIESVEDRKEEVERARVSIVAALSCRHVILERLRLNLTPAVASTKVDPTNR